MAIITVTAIQAETTLMADRSAETGLIEQVGGFIGDSANVDGDVIFSIGPKMHLASLDDDVLSISETSPVLPAVVSDIEVVEDSICVAMSGMGIASLECAVSPEREVSPRPSSIGREARSTSDVDRLVADAECAGSA